MKGHEKLFKSQELFDELVEKELDFDFQEKDQNILTL